MFCWDMNNTPLQWFDCEYRDKGLTPEIPSNCPQKLVELMKMCWKKQPQQRPVSFLCFLFPVFCFSSFHTQRIWFVFFFDWNVDRILIRFVKCWSFGIRSGSDLKNNFSSSCESLLVYFFVQYSWIIFCLIGKCTRIELLRVSVFHFTLDSWQRVQNEVNCDGIIGWWFDFF
jgi:hypothetical protein